MTIMERLFGRSNRAAEEKMLEALNTVRDTTCILNVVANIKSKQVADNTADMLKREASAIADLLAKIAARRNAQSG